MIMEALNCAALASCAQRTPKLAEVDRFDEMAFESGCGHFGAKLTTAQAL
jgi:hypothetical protein